GARRARHVGRGGAAVRPGLRARRRADAVPARRGPAAQPLGRGGPPRFGDGHVVREPGALGRARREERRLARAEGIRRPRGDRPRDREAQARDDGHLDRPADRGAGALPRLVGRGHVSSAVLSSLEIAQSASLRPIAELAADAGLEPDEIELYVQYKGKVNLSVLDRLAAREDAKLGCVTAITPTKAGEGKTTTSVSLTQ